MPSVIYKEFSQLIPITTNHNVGEKRVLISLNENSSPITQIAITKLCSGDYIKEHIHYTMDEYFIILKGECDIVVNGISFICKGGCFICIPEKSSHSINVILDTELITIGVAKN
jgi:mannose-6-phosphate isomerase-like protein (cupin superfamily)